MKSPFVPRPPETTTDASVKSGRPPLTTGAALVTVASFDESESVTANSSTAAEDVVTTGSIELERKVMIGVPVVTLA